jgi:hypothetical protein
MRKLSQLSEILALFTCGLLLLFKEKARLISRSLLYG